MLSLVFSVGFENPALGTNFALYYATGMVPFVLYNDIANKVADSLQFSRPFMAYPSVSFIDSILARFMLNFLTQLMVACIVFSGLVATLDTRVILDIPLILLGMLLGAALALGIGTANCYLTMRFVIWRRVWSVLNRPLFIISCVFFLLETIPQPYRDHLWYNPLVHVIGLLRRGFYANYDAPYVSIGYVLLVAGVTFLFGLVMLLRGHRDLLQN